jgi:hypothetical protein
VTSQVTSILRETQSTTERDLIDMPTRQGIPVGHAEPLIARE